MKDPCVDHSHHRYLHLERSYFVPAKNKKAHCIDLITAIELTDACKVTGSVPYSVPSPYQSASDLMGIHMRHKKSE
jgi:hypothetical protein